MERFADLVLLPISLFSGRPLAVSIALLILLAAGALYAVIYFLFEKPFLAAYDEATKAVATARRRDPAQTRAITNVGAALAQSKFAELWDQYRASFDFSGNDAFNYTDPAAFFDGDRLEGHNYPKWSTTLGGVFLTVGLFFTFVGLSAALLQVAGDGHGAATDPARLRNAVEKILDISSVKFITSLAGILAYIFWSLVARFQTDAQERAVARLTNEIRRLSSYASPEKLLLQQLQVQREQHQQFQVFGQNLAVAIGQQIDQALTNSFGDLSTKVGEKVGEKVKESLGPICELLEAIGATIGKTGGQIADGAGEAFTKMWKTAMDGSMASFSVEMGKIVAALQGLPETVAKVETILGGRIGTAGQDLSSAVERLIAAFEGQQRSMKASVDDFNAKIAAIPGVASSASEASVEALRKAIEEALENLARTTLKAGQTASDRLATDVGKIAAALAAAAQTLQAATDASTKNLSNAGEDIRNSAREGIEALAKVIEDLRGALAQSTLQLGAQHRELRDAGGVVASASTGLKAAADGVARATTPLAETIAALRGSVDAMTVSTSQMRDTSETERQSAEALRGVSEVARRAFEGQASRFSGLQDNVRSTMETLVAGVQQLADEISTCIQTYDSAVAKSIGGLENAIIELLDITDNKPRAPGQG